MKTLISMTLILLSLGSKAQENAFIGEVSHNGKPVENAVISVNNKLFWTVTDSTGNFELRLPDGSYLLEISSLGCVPIRERLAFPEREKITHRYELQTDVLGIDEVVVTASRNPVSGRNSPVRVGITAQRELTAVKSLTLREGLNFQSGLRTEINCQNCGFTQLRINGLEGSYSQILINGRPSFGSLNGIYGLEQIPTEMIQQIEVVRGGGSALYGSNAIAGTVNVITKNPTKNQYSIGSTLQFIGGKSADWVNAANGSVVSENFARGLTFYAMHRNRNPYDADEDGFSEITRLRNRNFGFKLFNEFSSRKKIEAEAMFGVERRRGGNLFHLPEHQADIAESIQSDVAGTNVNYEYFSPSQQQKISIYGAYQANRSDNYYGTRQDTEGYGLTTENIFLAGSQHTVFFNESGWQLTSGIEWKREQLSENRLRENVLEISQLASSLGIFTQADWRLSQRLKMLAGVRLERIGSEHWQRAVTAVNPRAGLLWNVTDGWSVRASYARGFRAPLFYSEDVHSEMIPGEVRMVRISSSLKKETSDSYTASFEYSKSTNNSQLQIIFEPFLTRLYNPFVYVDIGKVNGLAIREKQNGQAATVRGVNSEVKYSPSPELTLQCTATVQRGSYAEKYSPEDGIETDRILRSPDWYGSFIVTYVPFPKWTLNASAVATGPMQLVHLEGYIAENRLVETASFFDLSCNVSKEFSFGGLRCELSGGIKNIINDYQKDFDKGIDRDPAYIYGPALPRTVFAGVKVFL
ncbi:MAG: TonB-dependent receptor [Capnocytophaga sp.]|nr:TonB-dependent receptor [Capnocytophaga sp.]